MPGAENDDGDDDDIISVMFELAEMRQGVMRMQGHFCDLRMIIKDLSYAYVENFESSSRKTEATCKVRLYEALEDLMHDAGQFCDKIYLEMCKFWERNKALTDAYHDKLALDSLSLRIEQFLRLHETAVALMHDCLTMAEVWHKLLKQDINCKVSVKDSLELKIGSICLQLRITINDLHTKAEKSQDILAQIHHLDSQPPSSL